MLGGGGYNGSYRSCIFRGNVATNSGGAVYGTSQMPSTNCFMSGNLAMTNGGGVFGGVWLDCKLVGNSAGANGGGANNASLTRSIVTDNLALLGGGVYNTTVSQCLLTRNTADIGGGAYNGSGYAVNHSTVVANSATNAGGGVYASSASVPLLSSICYFNNAPVTSNYSGGVITYCCLMPLSPGTGNITNDPVLIDRTGGNFRLQTSSPCINAGGGFALSPIDLDGRPRIVGAKIDMGAYEFQGAGVGEFIQWLGQNNLPIGGSADYADADSDQMNNWQEWVAGTNPTNSESVLKLVSLTTSDTGATLSWQSVVGRNYWIERTDDLGSPSGFSLIQSNLSGLVGLTSFTDSEATNSVEYFYRVGVK
jgi:predicted outer membrane repeat protein